MQTTIRASLAAAYDPRVVDELLASHEEAKNNYYLGGLRLSAVEGGRFAEAAFRMLQQETSGSFTALGKTLPRTDKLLQQFEQSPAISYPESVRLHIPRGLRMVYDIRNKRDAAHLGDGIDPNLQDATLIVSILDWVLAEFVRLHHKVSANEAQSLVEEIATRFAPVVQDFNGFLKLLNPRLGATDQVLVLLYQRGSTGAKREELGLWVNPKSRQNIRRTLDSLVHAKAFAHQVSDRYWITRTGQQEVERRRLVGPSSRRPSRRSKPPRPAAMSGASGSHARNVRTVHDGHGTKVAAILLREPALLGLAARLGEHACFRCEQLKRGVDGANPVRTR